MITHDGVELSEADKEKVRPHLQIETVDTIHGTRGELAQEPKEKEDVKVKDEVGKPKQKAVENPKVQ